MAAWFLVSAPVSAIDTVMQTLRNMLSGFLERLPYIVIGLIVFGAVFLAGRLIGNLLCRAGKRTPLHQNLAELLSRLIAGVAAVLGFLIAAVIIFPTFKPGDLIAGLGITSLALGFAFKDIMQNFLAGILILWRQPFQIGDQIRSGEWEGTVENIDTRATRIKTYDGERVVLPNGDVYTRAILVRTAYPHRRVRFTVGIGYQDAIEQARKVIQDVLARTEGVMPDPGPWVYVTELAPSSVNLTVYFWTGSQQANVLAVSNRVATAVKLALDEAQIDMPYPHQVVFWHDQTGSLEADRERQPDGNPTRADSPAQQYAKTGMRNGRV